MVFWTKSVFFLNWWNFRLLNSTLFCFLMSSLWSESWVVTSAGISIGKLMKMSSNFQTSSTDSVTVALIDETSGIMCWSTPWVTWEVLTGQPFVRDGFVSTVMWSMLVMPGQRSQAPEHFQEIQRSVERDPAGTSSERFQVIPWCFIREPMDCGSLMTWRCWACNEWCTCSTLNALD